MGGGPASRPRHGRQVRLVEVGEAGQARIGRARAIVREHGLAAWVETRYLAGAGIGGLTVPSAKLARAAAAVDATVAIEVATEAPVSASSSSDATLDDLGLRDPAARAVAAGALAALAVLRGAILEAS